MSDRGESRIFVRRGCTSKEWRHWQWAKKFLKVNTYIRNFISGGGGVRTPCTLPLDPPLIIIDGLFLHLSRCLFLGPINLLMSPKSVILSAFSVRRTVESKAAVVDFVGVTPKRRPCRQTADYRRQTVQTMSTVQTEYFFSNTWFTFFSSTVTK